MKQRLVEKSLVFSEAGAGFQLFKWRKANLEGSLIVVGATETVVKVLNFKRT